MKPGIYYDITNGQYHADTTAVSKSGLVKMTCPAKYKHHLDNPDDKPDSDAMLFGRAFHSMLDGTRDFLVWESARRGTAWEAFKAAADGQDIITTAQYEQAEAMADALIEHPVASDILENSLKEVTAVAELDGVLCKARADLHVIAGEYRYTLADIKTCTSAAPDAFVRDVERYHYDVQAAFYSDIFEANDQKIDAFIFIAVEKDPPHVVEVYEADLDIVLSGRRMYLRLLEKLKECRKSSQWPTYNDERYSLLSPKPYGRMAPISDLTMGGKAVSL